MGCIENSDFQRVAIPDENTGSIKVPSNWVFKVIDGWIQIIDQSNQEIIGTQLLKREYISMNGVSQFESITNPHFDSIDSISYLEGQFGSGSNGAIWAFIKLTTEDDTSTYRYLYLSNASHYIIEIIIWNDIVEDQTLTRIVDSFQAF